MTGVTAVKTPILKSVIVQGNWAYLGAYLKEFKMVDTLGFRNSLGRSVRISGLALS